MNNTTNPKIILKEDNIIFNNLNIVNQADVIKTFADAISKSFKYHPKAIYIVFDKPINKTVALDLIINDINVCLSILGDQIKAEDFKKVINALFSKPTIWSNWNYHKICDLLINNVDVKFVKNRLKDILEKIKTTLHKNGTLIPDVLPDKQEEYIAYVDELMGILNSQVPILDLEDNWKTMAEVWSISPQTIIPSLSKALIIDEELNDKKQWLVVAIRNNVKDPKINDELFDNQIYDVLRISFKDKTMYSLSPNPETIKKITEALQPAIFEKNKLFLKK